MIHLKLPRFEQAGFLLGPAEGAGPRVCFSGNGDSKTVPFLREFLKLLHDELLDKPAASVEVDMTDLYFMNSSCLKQLVTWIHGVDTGGRPYRIVLQMNSRQQWQLRSLATLQRLAPKVVTIQELSK